jgi:DNA mismatch repair protein MutL
MRDLIQLLPENVANQIAAGEVVQRPASVVKELLENAIDAGATQIQLIVKDAGKTLIQVIDNGRGMSQTDLRMAFERHATSKIRAATDLFALATMGFRGEALASIAAVAQVHCASRMNDDEVAHFLRIEGGKLVESGQEAKPVGTSMEVKNLFYNIPARRQFLKSDQVEINHITDEFQRVALAHPEVSMRFFHNHHELFHLPIANLRQRIVGVMGKKIDKHLLSVEEKTEHVSIKGFVAKPEAARKKRGEQFFFVNHRFIRHHVLHHAVVKAFEDLISPGFHPSYFLFIEVDPATIDVNIHPTKTEISFVDEKMVYAMLSSSVKHSLGKHNVAPSLDFESTSTFNLPASQLKNPPQQPKIQVDVNYNPFKSKYSEQRRPATQGWEKLMVDDLEVKNIPQENTQPTSTFSFPTESQANQPSSHFNQNTKANTLFGSAFIQYQTSDSILFIHPRRAHERVLYEELMKSLKRQTSLSQQLLFPVEVELSPADAKALTAFIPTLQSLGFDSEIQDNEKVIFFGLPSFLNESSLPEIVEGILNDINEIGELDEEQFNRKLIINLAQSGAVRQPDKLQPEAVDQLVKDLFACHEPMLSPRGKTTIFKLTLQDIQNYFSA